MYGSKIKFKKIRKYFKLNDKEYSEYQNCGIQLKQCLDEN